MISPRCRFNQQRRSSNGANTIQAVARCKTHTAVETLMVLVDCLPRLKLNPFSICPSHSTSCSIAVTSPAPPLRSGSSLYPCLNSSKIIDYRASTIAAFLCNRRTFPLIRVNEGNYGVPRAPLGSGYASRTVRSCTRHRLPVLKRCSRRDLSTKQVLLLPYIGSPMRRSPGRTRQGCVNGTEKTPE
ncbi:hypothetical protein C8R21_1275 [Nitrosospira multiformis]|uniref:Uncharacterized protein n=1 Tax=Nitrosospira multiformis TaxID=1231 RepID=A0A2T5I6P7_9PROT|nr:hypothetical protein C8R21_1275 [Nitrosospira multiformis]